MDRPRETRHEGDYRKTSDPAGIPETQTGIARYADQGAERIEQFARHLRERDTSQLVRETERLARRQPALFLAGAFALGFLGARFFKGAGQEMGSDER